MSAAGMRWKPGPITMLLVLGGGCGPLEPRWPWTTPSIPPPTVEKRLAEADAEVAAGRPRTAMALYEDVIREHAGQEPAARALHAIAVLRLDPRSPTRDRRAALQLFARIAEEYPTTSWGREAKMWRLLFRQIDRCELEANRLGADVDRMRQTLDSLKDTDLELEGRP